MTKEVDDTAPRGALPPVPQRRALLLGGSVGLLAAPLAAGIFRAEDATARSDTAERRHDPVYAESRWMKAYYRSARF